MQILTRLNKIIAYSEYGYVPVGNSAICATTGERYDNVLITTVDYVPTDIDQYNYYYIDGKFIKGGVSPEMVLNLISQIPEEIFRVEYRSIEILEKLAEGTISVGNLTYLLCGGAVHIYGDLTLTPNAEKTAGYEKRSFMFEGFDGFVAPPGGNLLFSQAISTQPISGWDYREPCMTSVCVECGDKTLVIPQLTTKISECTLHVNIMYNILSDTAMG